MREAKARVRGGLEVQAYAPLIRNDEGAFTVVLFHNTGDCFDTSLYFRLSVGKKWKRNFKSQLKGAAV